MNKYNSFFCFIHIEKCAGTTFSHSLKYKIPEYLSLKPWYYWSNEPENYLSVKELKYLLKLFPFLKGIGGHTTRTYAGYESVVNKEIKYFTFVRNPIDRYMSHYNHQVNKMGINWSIESFLNESRFNNFITRRIAGKDDLNLAIDRINNDYSFVGLFEKFDESLLLLNQFVLNNAFEPYYEFKNDSKNEKKIRFEGLDEKNRNKIYKNNELDLKLYDYIISKVYPEYLQQYQGDIKKDVAEFRKKNKHFQYKKIRYLGINSTRIITEFVIEKIAHQWSKK